MRQLFRVEMKYFAPLFDSNGHVIYMIAAQTLSSSTKRDLRSSRRCPFFRGEFLDLLDHPQIEIRALFHVRDHKVSVGLRQTIGDFESTLNMLLIFFGVQLDEFAAERDRMPLRHF